MDRYYKQVVVLFLSCGIIACTANYISQTEISSPGLTDLSTPNQIDNIDEDEMSVTIFGPTITKWLSGQNIDRDFLGPTADSIREITGKTDEGQNEGDVGYFESFRYEPTLLDVDGDGEKELFIRSQCAAVGNCQLWIFGRQGDGYRILLNTPGGVVQTFRLLRDKTNGVFDLETRDHADAWSGGISVYKYDLERYRLDSCSTYSYAVLNGGRIIELKKPIIKHVPCTEE